MIRRYILVASLATAACGLAHAQEFAVTSANIADGAAGVSAVDTFYFSLNKKLPFNSLFTNGFRWEPPRLALRRYIFLDADRDRPRFTIEHQAATDYSVWVYGVRAEDGTPMARPFTLNYTTLASHGQRDVSGAVTFADRTPPSLGDDALLVKALTREAFAAQASALTGGATARHSGSEMPEAGVPVSVEVRESVATGLGRSVAAAQDLRATVVFLLDAYVLNLNAGRWRARAAAALDAQGRYRFDHVRDGTYYPVAINFADADGTMIGSYGYYDPDGDYEPDPITVSGGNLTGVDLALYTYESSTAFSSYDLAVSRARAVAVDARLVALSSPLLLSSGAAYNWTYEFHSAARGERIVVALDPVAVRTSSAAADSVTASRPTIVPAEVIDSDRALEIAEANGGAEFRSRHAAEAVAVIVEGGNVPRLPDGSGEDPVGTDDPVWHIDYVVPDPFDQLTLYLDMRTGAVVTLPTSAEPGADGADFALRPAVPNPFSSATAVTVELAEAARVRVAVYDALGREVAVLADGLVAAGAHRLVWDAAGFPAGTYLCRAETGGVARTRTLLLVR